MLIGTVFSTLVIIIAFLVLLAEFTALDKDYEVVSGIGFGFVVNKDVEKRNIELQTVLLCVTATYIWRF